MMKTTLSGFSVAVLFLSLLMFSGCISDQGRFSMLELSGHVRHQSDSSSVQGALVLFSVGSSTSQSDTFSDSTGFFSFTSTFPSEHYDTIPFTVTVADADGEANGLFLSQDTVLVEEHPDDSTMITFEVDFYVELLE